MKILNDKRPSPMEEYFCMFPQSISGDGWPLFQKFLFTIAVFTCQAKLMKGN